MKFEELLTLVRDLPFFDLALLVQLSDEPRPALLTQLHRLVKAKKIVSLRRGMYALAATYRQAAVHPPQLANAIYAPSYLSGLWALSYHGAIPEHVAVLTSVTPRTTKRFNNAFGAFDYRHVKRSLFFGFAAIPIGGVRVSLASAEKALVDHWHLEHGEWTERRLRALRLDPGALHLAALEQIVARTAQPRLLRALESYRRIEGESSEGEVAL